MFNKLFGKKSKGAETSSSNQSEDLAKDPNMIRFFDEHGREYYITKQQWRDKVLLGNLEKARNNPEQLYNLIITAIRDNFFDVAVPYAEHLKKIDPVPSRAATILGIVYMETNRLDDAKQVLEEFIAKHGEDGIVLTNLAKVYSRKGNNAQSEIILWHALELDPNQDNGLLWYVMMEKERLGEGADIEAYRRIAKLPRSWRARLWLARDALQRSDVATAQRLYEEALTLVGHPKPPDLLMQMTGDLGNAGLIAEIIQLASPHFDANIHGIQTGNNLIKAYLELGQVENAKLILEQLYTQKRPDWKETLNYWETELAKASVVRQSQKTESQPLPISLIGIEGPLWTRDGSPFISLLQPKKTNAIRVAVFGSTAIQNKPPHSPELQLTDTPGRFSRSIPLKLAEDIHLSTDAIGISLIPFVTDKGFALFGAANEDSSLSQLARKGEKASEFVVGFAINSTQSIWKLNIWLIRCEDSKRIEEKTFDSPVENIGSVVDELSETLNQWLNANANVHVIPLPHWYQKMSSNDETDYLVRLEQQLAVLYKQFDTGDGYVLYNEREILDGVLHLCLRQEKNQRVRMLFAQTLRQMKKARPELLSEYKEKTEQLQQKYPLSGEINSLLEKAFKESFS